MTIITPYRPLAHAPPQVQPHVVAGGDPSAVNVASYDGNVVAPGGSSRTLIYEDNFASGYENRFPNRAQYNLGGSPQVQRSYTTMNGEGAVTLTWSAGSAPNVTHNLSCDMLGGPYEEIYFTQQVRYENNYAHGPQSQSRGTQKFITIHPVTGSGTPGGGNPCPSNNWGLRVSTRAGSSVGNIPEGKVSLGRYSGYPDQPSTFGHWSNFPAFLNTGQIYEFEWYWKLNSASNVADGKYELRVDGVKVSNKDYGETFKWYCGGEGNRSGARANQIRWHFFYGGSGSGWEPWRDSSLTLGYWKLETPA